MRPAEVAVVIRSFDRRDLLPRAVASALQQTVPAGEILVVDDGSSDGTAEWVRAQSTECPNLRLLSLAERQGAAAAANAGLAATAGDFIAFLDSDDEWHPRFLELSLAALGEEGGAVAYCDFTQVWDEFGLERLVRLPFPEDQRRAMLLAPFIPCLSLALLRRQAVETAGGFDAGLGVASDLDLLGRLALGRPEAFCAVPLALARRHLHRGNLLRDGALWQREMLAVTDRLFHDPRTAAYAALLPQARDRIVARAGAADAQRARLAAPGRRVVSAVIVTRNRRALLERAIASVDRQQDRPREIVVVDDGSEDDTAAWLAGLKRPDLFSLRVPNSVGIATARNLGWRAARGEIIAMLDDDDEWLPDYLTSVVRAFALTPEPLYVYADCYHRRPGETKASQRIYHAGAQLYPDLVTQLLLLPVPVSSTLFAVSRERLERIGGYDERFLRCEDADLYLRLAASEGQATPVHIARPLALRLIHDMGRDAQATARANLRFHRLRLDSFFASAAGAPYRSLAEQAWRTISEAAGRYQAHYGDVTPPTAAP